MKIELKKIDAERVFKMVSNVNQGNMIPITNETLINFFDGRMELFATDTEISISTSIDIVSSEGLLSPIVCDTNMIMKTISSLKTETIFMEVAMAENGSYADLTITVPKSKKEYTINLGFRAKDFLKKPEFVPGHSISVPGNRFVEIIRSTGVFIDNKDIRGGWLTGISMYDDENKIKFVGGDQFGFNIIHLDSDESLGKVIIPKTISGILDLFSSSANIEVSIDSNGSHMMIKSGSSTFTIRLISGEVSSAERVFRHIDKSSYVRLNREDLISCIGRLVNFAGDIKEPALSMDFSGDDIILECEDVHRRKKGTEELTRLSFAGDASAMRCTTNAKKLEKILRTFSSEVITIVKNSDVRTPMIIHDDSGRGFYSEYYLAIINTN